MPSIPKPIARPGVVMALRPSEHDASLSGTAKQGVRDRSAAVARAMPWSATQREFLARLEASGPNRPAMQDLTAAFGSPSDAPRTLRKRDVAPFSKTRKQDG